MLPTRKVTRFVFTVAVSTNVYCAAICANVERLNRFEV